MEIYILLALVGFNLIFLVWLAVVHFRLARLLKAYSQIFQGKSGADLESVIDNQKKQLAEIENVLKNLYNQTQVTQKISQKSLRKVGIIRYNPFDNVGGDQSFSMAVLDSADSGFVISSLHGREGTRVYTKPVKNLESKYSLSAEEKEALNKALGGKRRK